MKRYFLDEDTCGHWYVIPLDMMIEWNKWLDYREDDERSWSAPSWARGVNGSQIHVTFTDPQINNGS